SVYTCAQDQHALQLTSISADFKLISQDYSAISFEKISALTNSFAMFSTIDLSSYRGNSSYQFNINSSSQHFVSPGGPVNTRSIIGHSRIELSTFFSMLNHKSNEYRLNRELSFGLVYQPVRYHQSQFTRTDTITTD